MNQFLRIVVALCGLFASTSAFTTPAPARATTSLNIVDPAIVDMVDKSDAFATVLFGAGFVGAWELLTPGRANKDAPLQASSPKEYLLNKTPKSP